MSVGGYRINRSYLRRLMAARGSSRLAPRPGGPGGHGPRTGSSRPYVASSGGLLGQPAWRGGETPVVRGEERKAGRDGVVAQNGDHWPGPQPGGLVGNPPAVVKPVVVDAVQQ